MRLAATEDVMTEVRMVGKDFRALAMTYLEKNVELRSDRPTRQCLKAFDIQISRSLWITWKIIQMPVFIETSSMGSGGSPE